MDDPEESDKDSPLPLGAKLPGYRLLNIVVIFTIGVAKFILSLEAVLAILRAQAANHVPR